MEPDYDIVIVGGGVAGLSFASSLVGHDCRILIIDSGKPPRFTRDDYDLRVNSINIASETFFNSTDVWRRIRQKRVNPFHAIDVWDSVGGSIQFAADEIDENCLGHIVENSVLTSSLTEVINEADNITVRYGVEVREIDNNDKHANLKLDDASQISAFLVVGADGGNSQVRRISGITFSEKYYQQVAYVAMIKVENPAVGVSFQKFLVSGPLALLPLKDDIYSIVWSCDTELAQELDALDDVKFQERLSAVLDDRFGYVTLLSDRVSFQLKRLTAGSYVAGRCVVMGDAAHVVHPLAGMGANLGIMDAAALGQVIREIRDFENPNQSHPKLREFERWRKSENTLASVLIDGFDRGFTNPRQPMQSMLGLGLSMSNRIGTLKGVMMRYACGLTGDLPLSATRT